MPNLPALGLARGAWVSVVIGSPVFLGVGLAVGAALMKRRELAAALGLPAADPGFIQGSVDKPGSMIALRFYPDL